MRRRHGRARSTATSPASGARSPRSSTCATRRARCRTSARSIDEVGPRDDRHPRADRGHGHRAACWSWSSSTASPSTTSPPSPRSAHDPKPLVRALLDFWFLTGLRDGVFHGDIHAGNLMLLRDGRLGVIDWGIVGVLDEHDAPRLPPLRRGHAGRRRRRSPKWPSSSQTMLPFVGDEADEPARRGPRRHQRRCSRRPSARSTSAR